MELIRVLLVDDQTGVRAGLKMRLALEPDITVVGEAGNGVDALATVLTRPVDVVVMDVEMPGMSGIEATAALGRNGVTAAVVLLSMHDNAAVRMAAKQAGASAFIAKHEPSESLIAAIRDAAASRQAALR